MQTSRKLTHALTALFMLVVMSAAAFAQNQPYPASSEMSDQKAGSVLVWNYYNSSSTATNSDTAITITNTNSQKSAFVHLFFVSSTAGCAVADYKLELTRNQTKTFYASFFDPDQRGYLIAVAENPENGWPTSFNYLIGSEYFKNPTIGAGALGAEAFAALFEGDLPGFTADAIQATLRFDGVSYNRLPSVLALSSLPSPSDNDTTLILNGFGGNLSSGVSGGTSYFVLVYDERENSYSTSITGGCQRQLTVNDTNIRIPQRFTNIIPSGYFGWMRLDGRGNPSLGAVVNKPKNVDAPGAFGGAHNLHVLALAPLATLTVPVFVSSIPQL